MQWRHVEYGKTGLSAKFVSAVPTNGVPPFTNANFPAYPRMTVPSLASAGGWCDADLQVTEVRRIREDATLTVLGGLVLVFRAQQSVLPGSRSRSALRGHQDLVWGDTEGTGACTQRLRFHRPLQYANPSNASSGGQTTMARSVGPLDSLRPAAQGTQSRISILVWTRRFRCAKSATWDPATTEIVTTQVDDNTIKFVAPEGARTILHTPEQMRVPEETEFMTNHAEVNGIKLEATATVQSNSSANGGATPTTIKSQARRAVRDRSRSRLSRAPLLPLSRLSRASHRVIEAAAVSAGHTPAEPSSAELVSHDPKSRSRLSRELPSYHWAVSAERPSHDPKSQPSGRAPLCH